MYYPDYYIDHPDHSIQVDYQFECGPDTYLMWFTSHLPSGDYTLGNDHNAPCRMPTQWQPSCDI